MSLLKFHSLFFYLFETKLILLLLHQPRINFFNIRGEYNPQAYVHSSNEMCAPFYTSPNCSTDSSPQNVLTCNIALGQEAVAIRFLIDLGLMELHNLQDSVAPHSQIDPSSRESGPRMARAITQRDREVFERLLGLAP